MRARIILAVAGVAAFLAGAALFVQSRRQSAQPPSTARRPVRPDTRPRSDPEVQATLDGVAGLRKLRSKAPVAADPLRDPEYMALLDRVRAGARPSLTYLEEIVLNRAEETGLRLELLKLIAEYRGDETRMFLATLLADPAEESVVRVAALYGLTGYRDAETFEVLRRVFSEDRFPGRYHVCLAVGENGRPEGLPLLRRALGAREPAEIRIHAAAALGGYAGDPAVRDELRRIASEDALPLVRQNALRSLARSPAEDVDEFLRKAAATGEDEPTRRVAEGLLNQRAVKR